MTTKTDICTGVTHVWADGEMCQCGKRRWHRWPYPLAELGEGDVLTTKDGYAYRIAAPPLQKRGRLEVVLERAEYDDRIDDDSPYADRDE